METEKQETSTGYQNLFDLEFAGKEFKMTEHHPSVKAAKLERLLMELAQDKEEAQTIVELLRVVIAHRFQSR